MGRVAKKGKASVGGISGGRGARFGGSWDRRRGDEWNNEKIGGQGEASFEVGAATGIDQEFLHQGVLRGLFGVCNAK